MEKPISVVMSELNSKISAAVDEAKLHPSILEQMFSNYLSSIRLQARDLEMRESLAWANREKEEAE